MAASRSTVCVTIESTWQLRCVVPVTTWGEGLSTRPVVARGSFEAAVQSPSAVTLYRVLEMFSGLHLLLWCPCTAIQTVAHRCWSSIIAIVTVCCAGWRSWTAPHVWRNISSTLTKAVLLRCVLRVLEGQTVHIEGFSHDSVVVGLFKGGCE